MYGRGHVVMETPLKFPPDSHVTIHLAGVDAEWHRGKAGGPIEPGTKGRVVAVRGDRAERVVELPTGERVVLTPDSLRAAR
jgi:hypothetical protein